VANRKWSSRVQNSCVACARFTFAVQMLDERLRLQPTGYMVTHSGANFKHKVVVVPGKF